MKKPSLPIQLLIVLSIVILFGNQFSENLISIFYSISLTFKEALSALLPFIVFSFICTGILSLKRNAPIIVSILLYCILVSNSTIALSSYFISKLMLSGITDGVIINSLKTASMIQPLWTVSIPKIISSEHGMILALTTGFFLSFIKLPRIELAIFKLKNSIEWIMTKIFIPILPLYVFGFLIEIHHEGVFLQLSQSYGKTFSLIFTLHFLAIFLIYSLANNFKYKKTFRSVINAVPSYLTAFGTMSSTAAIPVTINSATLNINNRPLAQIAAPILANVHLLGDAISTPILAMTTIFLFTGTIPTFTTFAIFVIYFCLTMLAVSGVPGGGIIVMIPILKTILGFSDGMISVITTLYLLQDAFGTAANVMGDGALIIIVNKILKKLRLA